MCCSLSFPPVGFHLSPLHLTGVGGGVFKILFMILFFFWTEDYSGHFSRLDVCGWSISYFSSIQKALLVYCLLQYAKNMCECEYECVCVSRCSSMFLQISVCPRVFSKKSPCPRQAARFVHDKTVYFIITGRRLLPVQRQKEVPLVLLFSCFWQKLLEACL